MGWIPDSRTLLEYYQMGGFVMPPLVAVAMSLWFALAWRAMSVRSSRSNPRDLLAKIKKQQPHSNSILAKATKAALELQQKEISHRQLKSLIEERFQEIKSDINAYRWLVRSLVAVAPLLGLLGTVDGMIETFNSLGDMALFSATGGIAGGISKALFTTQMGLAISIPGLLLGRMIERQQMNINWQLDQVKDLICAEKQ